MIPILRRSIPAALVAGLLPLLGLARPARLTAQDVMGEWVMLVQGNDGIAITFRPAEGGRVTGVMAAAGRTLPLNGKVTGSRVSFVVASADGQQFAGDAALQGDQLGVTFHAPGQPDEHYVLTRRGSGWSDATPLARRWTALLAGRTVSYTDRTDGGPAGGAATTHVFTFCANGTGAAEKNTVLSVYTPGAGGSQTAKQSMRFTWRAITRGQEIAVALTGEDGSRTQVAVTGGEGGVVTLGDKAMRLHDAGARCR
ncbi:MAG TPA: hypothetical protein VFQ38_01700 [Longimicrobiales bacterium]|nr:hypothetical protein [Longimicrobiales bacterium]